MRLRALLVAVLMIAGLAVPAAATSADPPHVLVWTGTYGFRHPSITDAQLAFLQLAESTGAFTVEITENPADLSAAKLRDVDVLAWVSTTGKPPMLEQQREDVIRWAYCGGGTMAFHAAADSNYGWAEYAELIGAQFDSHPYTGNAQMNVEDDQHPITEGWQGQTSFQISDEWYRWRAAKRIPGVSLPRSLDDVHVLLSLEEETIPASIQEGATPYEDDQPIAWTKTFRGGGRVYYNNMGHNGSTWGVAEFRTSLVKGVGWVSETRLDPTCFEGDTPLPAPAAPPVLDPDAAIAPCEVPAVTPRTGGTWERSGEVRRLTPAGDSVTVATGIPGNLGWGAQGYVLDLSSISARAADVVVELDIPAPVDDYDLSVTAPWGWYGSHAPQGASSERVVVSNAPHCAILWTYADNLYGVTGQQPTIRVTVERAGSVVDEEPPGTAVPPVPGQVIAPQGATLLPAGAFAPAVVVLPQGSTLTFTNADQNPHNIQELPEGPRAKARFESDYAAPAQSVQVRGVPDLPVGTYTFICGIHTTMSGQLRIV